MTSFVWNLKRNDTNEFISKTETGSQTQKLNLWLPGGRDIQGVWNGHAYTAIFKMDNQQGPTVQFLQGTLLDVMGSLDGRGLWGSMDTCIYMAEFLHYSSETITTLLIGYTSI